MKTETPSALKSIAYEIQRPDGAQILRPNSSLALYAPSRQVEVQAKLQKAGRSIIRSVAALETQFENCFNITIGYLARYLSQRYGPRTPDYHVFGPQIETEVWDQNEAKCVEQLLYTPV